MTRGLPGKYFQCSSLAQTHAAVTLHELVRPELVEDAVLFDAHGGGEAARGKRRGAAAQVEGGLAAYKAATGGNHLCGARDEGALYLPVVPVSS